MRSCLRMKPDRILLAELRGGETYDWLQSVLSGHAGSITSCHAASCSAVFPYLAMKVMQSPVGKNIPYEEVMACLKRAIDVVVHIQNVRGRRSITGIYFSQPSQVQAHVTANVSYP
jgi:type IV secretory pathway ATPase VirB11/archaellum biosynthesis ATPase